MPRGQRDRNQRARRGSRPYMTRARVATDTPAVLDRLNRQFRDLASRIFPDLEYWCQPQVEMQDVPFFYRNNPGSFVPPAFEAFEVAFTYCREAMPNDPRERRVANQPFSSTQDGALIAQLQMWDFWDEPINLRRSLGDTHVVGVAKIDYYLRSPTPTHAHWYIFIDNNDNSINNTINYSMGR